jgi:hypothetical protein
MDLQLFFQVIGTATKLELKDQANSGGCTIHFGSNLDVVFESTEDKKNIHFFAQVLKLDITAERTRSRLFSTLLQLHLLGIATENCYFGFDPDLDRIILFRTLALENLLAQQAVQAVEEFVNQLERWQGELLNVIARQNSTENQIPTFSMQRM